MSKQQEHDVPVENGAEQQPSTHRNLFSPARLFWGVFAILIGILALGDNFGFLDVKWANLWQLWPLIIISIGLSLLSFRSIVGKIVSFLMVIVSLAIVAWALMWGGSSLVTITRDTTIDKLAPNVSQVNLNLKTGAGSVVAGSDDKTAVAKVNFQSNSLNLVQDTSVNGSTQRVNLSTAPIAGTWDGVDVKNSWKINLTRQLPVVLSADLGASNTTFDLSKVKLQSMDAKVGASNFDVKIGALQSVVNLKISGGASAIKIHIPQNSGVKLTLDSSLASKNLADLVNVSGNLYQSPNYEASSNQVIITANIGISSLDIDRY